MLSVVAALKQQTHLHTCIPNYFSFYLSLRLCSSRREPAGSQEATDACFADVFSSATDVGSAPYHEQDPRGL